MNFIHKGTTVFVLAACLLVLGADALAQRGEGRGPGEGRMRGGMGMMNQPTLIAADALLLSQEKTDVLLKADREARQTAMQSMRGGGSFRDMTREERVEYMQTVQQTISRSVASAMEDHLGEKEIETLVTILNNRPFAAVPEMRALRMIDLSDEQKLQLSPYTTGLATMLPSALNLDRNPEPGEADDQDDIRAAREKARTDLMAKVDEVLSEEQKIAWNEQTEVVKQEQVERRAQWRNARGFGGRRGQQ